MKNTALLSALSLLVMLLAAFAAGTGIWSSGGPGAYEYTSIRNAEVIIYGKGLYRHMSAEVAPQGIAQDYVTLFVAIPSLLIALYFASRGSLRGRFALTGVLGYFLVTYLFYLVMATYNDMFLVYVALTGLSFFSFLLSIRSFFRQVAASSFRSGTPATLIGGFLVFVARCIALLWLSIVVPPLLDGSIIPVETAHYTTLIGQGLDLAVLLPAAVISGILLMRRTPAGYLYATVYLVFLVLLMAALVAKIVAMGVLGFNIRPVVFTIPIFLAISLLCSITMLRNLIGQ